MNLHQIQIFAFKASEEQGKQNTVMVINWRRKVDEVKLQKKYQQDDLFELNGLSVKKRRKSVSRHESSSKKCKQLRSQRKDRSHPFPQKIRSAADEMEPRQFYKNTLPWINFLVGRL